MPGPLPSADRRRRNAPTIPTTALPAGGRTDPAPRVPKWIHLGKSGRAWWAWAWKTPQAAAWAGGMEAVVARRAVLEDDLAAVELAGHIDVAELLDMDHSQRVAEVESLFRTVARLAGGKMAIVREMREIDDRLGLSPKAMAALRWSIVADQVSEAREQRSKSSGRRLVAVDPSAVAGA